MATADDSKLSRAVEEATKRLLAKRTAGAAAGTPPDSEEDDEADAVAILTPRERSRAVEEHGEKGAAILGRLKAAFAARRKAVAEAKAQAKESGQEVDPGPKLSGWALMRTALVSRRVQLRRRRAHRKKALVAYVPARVAVPPPHVSGSRLTS